MFRGTIRPFSKHAYRGSISRGHNIASRVVPSAASPSQQQHRLIATQVRKHIKSSCNNSNNNIVHYNNATILSSSNITRMVSNQLPQSYIVKRPLHLLLPKQSKNNTRLSSSSPSKLLLSSGYYDNISSSSMLVAMSFAALAGSAVSAWYYLFPNTDVQRDETYEEVQQAIMSGEPRYDDDDNLIIPEYHEVSLDDFLPYIKDPNKITTSTKRRYIHELTLLLQKAAIEIIPYHNVITQNFDVINATIFDRTRSQHILEAKLISLNKARELNGLPTGPSDYDDNNNNNNNKYKNKRKTVDNTIEAMSPPGAITNDDDNLAHNDGDKDNSSNNSDNNNNDDNNTSKELSAKEKWRRERAERFGLVDDPSIENPYPKPVPSDGRYPIKSDDELSDDDILLSNALIDAKYEVLLDKEKIMSQVYREAENRLMSVSQLESLRRVVEYIKTSAEDSYPTLDQMENLHHDDIAEIYDDITRTAIDCAKRIAYFRFLVLYYDLEGQLPAPLNLKWNQSVPKFATFNNLTEVVDNLTTLTLPNKIAVIREKTLEILGGMIADYDYFCTKSPEINEDTITKTRNTIIPIFERVNPEKTVDQIVESAEFEEFLQTQLQGILFEKDALLPLSNTLHDMWIRATLCDTSEVAQMNQHELEYVYTTLKEIYIQTKKRQAVPYFFLKNYNLQRPHDSEFIDNTYKYLLPHPLDNVIARKLDELYQSSEIMTSISQKPVYNNGDNNDNNNV